MGAWRRFVKRATKALAGQPRPRLALGHQRGQPADLPEHLRRRVCGCAACARLRGRGGEANAAPPGRTDVEVGFTYAYRYLPRPTPSFGLDRELRDAEVPRGRSTTSGVQLYPGLFVPPTLVGETAGEATLEALTLVRDCYMPRPGSATASTLWISEVGLRDQPRPHRGTPAGRGRRHRDAVHALSGTLGVTDLRYFNLRDNRPDGTDLFDDVGLLRADYSPKPAFETYRRLIDRLGTRADATIPRP